MSVYHLRFEGGSLPSNKSDSVLLDWSPKQDSATIDTTKHFLPGWQLSTPMRAIMAFASAIYCVDKLALRDDSPDGWTRDLSLRVSGRGVEPLAGRHAELERILNFLTGDHWALEFKAPKSKAPSSKKSSAPVKSDAVCLFSGGLDSLCGAIQILEGGNSLCLISHHEGGIIAGRQSSLAARLADHYGADKVRHEQVWIGPAAPHADQVMSLPAGDREESTRSRSLLFILIGAVLACVLGRKKTLYIPENGFIGVNVPLIGSRLGSLSTRTTHPFFMSELQSILTGLGVDTELNNPYRLRTKGEVVAEAPNQDLLKELVADSISCAHPQAARWASMPQGNCGYCFPCLIRRASLSHVGLDSAAGYAYDVLSDPLMLDEGSDRSSDLRALLFGLSREPSPLAVLRSGAIPHGEAADFNDVYQRGRAEIREWLKKGASKTIRKTWPRVFS